VKLCELLETKHRFCSAVAVVLDGDSVLLGKSTAEDDRNDKWCFPGGGIKESESPETGATRECSEETGVKSSATNSAFTIPNMGHVAFVLCKREGGKIKPNHEFSEMKFVKLVDAMDMEDLFEPNRYVLDNLNANYPIETGSF
jgi:8-oxo-dGTP pyrophosphatase MutT (NUDIX family)